MHVSINNDGILRSRNKCNPKKAQMVPKGGGVGAGHQGRRFNMISVWAGYFFLLAFITSPVGKLNWPVERKDFNIRYLHHCDESSECATARQHKVAEVACYRLERTPMWCTDPISVLELTKKRSGWGAGGGVVTYGAQFYPRLKPLCKVQRCFYQHLPQFNRPRL